MVATAARFPQQPELISQIAERVRELAGSYEPPGFREVPGPDAALFLCAIDHRTGRTAVVYADDTLTTTKSGKPLPQVVLAQQT